MLLSLVGGRVTPKFSDGVLMMSRMTSLVYDHEEVKTEVTASVMELRELIEKTKGFIIHCLINVNKENVISKQYKEISLLKTCDRILQVGVTHLVLGGFVLLKVTLVELLELSELLIFSLLQDLQHI